MTKLSTIEPLFEKFPPSGSIDKLNQILESRFDLKLEASSTEEHLIDVKTIYEGKREMFLKIFGEARALGKPEYAKAVLISEAAKLLLREIAPKRTRKKSK